MVVAERLEALRLAEEARAQQAASVRIQAASRGLRGRRRASAAAKLRAGEREQKRKEAHADKMRVETAVVSPWFESHFYDSVAHVLLFCGNMPYLIQWPSLLQQERRILKLGISRLPGNVGDHWTLIVGGVTYEVTVPGNRGPSSSSAFKDSPIYIVWSGGLVFTSAPLPVAVGRSRLPDECKGLIDLPHTTSKSDIEIKDFIIRVWGPRNSRYKLRSANCQHFAKALYRFCTDGEEIPYDLDVDKAILHGKLTGAVTGAVLGFVALAAALPLVYGAIVASPLVAAFERLGADPASPSSTRSLGQAVLLGQALQLREDVKKRLAWRSANRSRDITWN
jgi:hypothetical protein